MKNIFLLLLPVLLIACAKSEQEVQKITEQSIAATWRLDAIRNPNDPLNPTTWQVLDYSKQTTSFDIFCVFDAQRNQSFLSVNSCSYDNGFSTISVAPNCATSAYTRDTTSQQLIKNDLSLSANHEFDWMETTHLSKRLFLVSQICASPLYEPENDISYEAIGQWSFNEATEVITVDYAPETSRLDGEPVNQFKVTEYTGSTLTIKQISTTGLEYRLRKL